MAVLGDHIARGCVVTKYDHLPPVLPCGCKRVEFREAAHPVPDEASVSGTNAIRKYVRCFAVLGGRPKQPLVLRALQDVDQHTVVVFVVSGGASALLCCPSIGLTLEDLRATSKSLLACGASIEELNAVRKHISAVKGGQLARLAAPASIVTLVLSDVIGDPLDVIASGPTVPDTSTFQDCMAIVERCVSRDTRYRARVPLRNTPLVSPGCAGMDWTPDPTPSHRRFLLA